MVDDTNVLKWNYHWKIFSSYHKVFLTYFEREPFQFFDASLGIFGLLKSKKLYPMCSSILNWSHYHRAAYGPILYKHIVRSNKSFGFPFWYFRKHSNTTSCAIFKLSILLFYITFSSQWNASTTIIICIYSRCTIHMNETREPTVAFKVFCHCIPPWEILI